MNERLKQIRKSLKLSQEEFGSRLGVSNTAISKLEISENNVTEQMAKSVCREFNVDYMWFTEGVGEMFCDFDDAALTLIDQIMIGENEFAKQVFKAFAKFDEAEWRLLENFIDQIFINKKKPTKKVD